MPAATVKPANWNWQRRLRRSLPRNLTALLPGVKRLSWRAWQTHPAQRASLGLGGAIVVDPAARNQCREECWKAPRGYPWATLGLSGGQPVAAQWLPRGYPLATPRLLREAPEARQRPSQSSTRQFEAQGNRIFLPDWQDASLRALRWSLDILRVAQG